MKLLFLASPLLAAVCATPLQMRQASTEFDVFGLSIGCVPHSSQCYYEFNVTVNPSLTVACDATAPSFQTIPNLLPTACEDAAVSFTYTLVDGGSFLGITWGYTVGHNLTGTHFIPASEVIWTNTENPNGAVQDYDGPPSFTITGLQDVLVA